MLPMPVIWLQALLHGYIGWRVAPDLPATWASAVCAGLLLVSAVLIPVSFIGHRRRGGNRRAADRLTWIGMLALGHFSMLVVLTLLRDVVLLLALPFNGAPPQLATWTAVAVPLLATAATLLGVGGARRIAKLRKIDVPMAGLPAALHGFTIAQISDLHIGPTVKASYVQAVVDRVNDVGADVVAITGDLIDGGIADLHSDVQPLAGLRSRYGSFFVTGNHEYYSGAPEWTAHLRTLGLRVLNNEHVLLGHGSAQLVLAGVTDFAAHHFVASDRSDPRQALAGAPQAAVRVLLAHQPRSATAAAAAGFDLQVSGHTHGGQFWPWNLFVPLQQPYTAGLHRLQQLWVYVSRGTGYWGPPMRLGAPSEIAVIRLVSAR